MRLIAWRSLRSLWREADICQKVVSRDFEIGRISCSWSRGQYQCGDTSWLRCNWGLWLPWLVYRSSFLCLDNQNGVLDDFARSTSGEMKELLSRSQVTYILQAYPLGNTVVDWWSAGQIHSCGAMIEHHRMQDHRLKLVRTVVQDMQRPNNRLGITGSNCINFGHWKGTKGRCCKNSHAYSRARSSLDEQLASQRVSF